MVFVMRHRAPWLAYSATWRALAAHPARWATLPLTVKPLVHFAAEHRTQRSTVSAMAEKAKKAESLPSAPSSPSSPSTEHCSNVADAPNSNFTPLHRDPRAIRSK